MAFYKGPDGETTQLHIGQYQPTRNDVNISFSNDQGQIVAAVSYETVADAITDIQPDGGDRMIADAKLVSQGYTRLG